MEYIHGSIYRINAPTEDFWDVEEARMSKRSAAYMEVILDSES